VLPAFVARKIAMSCISRTANYFMFRPYCVLGTLQILMHQVVLVSCMLEEALRDCEEEIVPSCLGVYY
jgi:hypothetical protein